MSESQVFQRSVTRCPDPIAVFRACTDGGVREGTALLETAETPEEAASAGRSLVVARSALHLRCRGRVVEVRALDRNGTPLLSKLAQRLEGGPQIELRRDALVCAYPPLPAGSEEQRLKAPSPVDVPRELMACLAAQVDQPMAAPLVVGTFAYDLLEYYEPLPGGQKDPLGWPDFELWLPDRLIWLDHQRGISTVVAHLFGDEDASEAYGEAVSAIAQLVEIVESAERMSTRASDERSGGAAGPDVEVDVDDATFADLVTRLKQHIVAGDVFQIVPSRTFSMPCLDALAAYRKLRGVESESVHVLFQRQSRRAVRHLPRDSGGGGGTAAADPYPSHRGHASAGGVRGRCWTSISIAASRPNCVSTKRRWPST